MKERSYATPRPDYDTSNIAEKLGYEYPRIKSVEVDGDTVTFELNPITLEGGAFDAIHRALTHALRPTDRDFWSSILELKSHESYGQDVVIRRGRRDLIRKVVRLAAQSLEADSITEEEFVRRLSEHTKGEGGSADELVDRVFAKVYRKGKAAVPRDVIEMAEIYDRKGSFPLYIIRETT